MNINERHPHVEPFSLSNLPEPARAEMPCHLKRLFQTSFLDKINTKSNVNFNLLANVYTELINKINALFTEIYDNGNFSVESIDNLNVRYNELNQLHQKFDRSDISDNDKKNIIKNIEGLESFLKKTIVFAKHIPAYEASAKNLHLAMEGLSDVSHESSQQGEALLAVNSIEPLVESLCNLWEAHLLFNEDKLAFEEIKELFEGELRFLSWQLEDWVEAVDQSVRQEHKQLSSMKSKQDLRETALVQERSLGTHLICMKEVMEKCVGILQNSPDPEFKKATASIVSSFQEMIQLAPPLKDLPEVALITYGSEHWLKLVEQRPEIKVGRGTSFWQKIIQPQSWSERTKRVVHSIFVGMQISQQAISVYNVLQNTPKGPVPSEKKIFKEQLSQIERESAALGNLLATKRDVLKTSPSSFDKLTKRYPEIRAFLKEYLDSPSDPETLMEAYRMQAIQNKAIQNNATPLGNFRQWWQVFTGASSAKPPQANEQRLLSPGTIKSAEVGSQVIDWLGNPEENKQEVVKEQIKNAILESRILIQQVSTTSALEDIRSEANLLQQELLRTSKNAPPDMCPIPLLIAWAKQVDEKCYDIQRLEQHIEYLMKASPDFLQSDDAALELFGKKHANIVKQARLVEALKISGVQVPIPYGISSDAIHAFLMKKVPEVFQHWEVLGRLYQNTQNPHRFLEEAEAIQQLSMIEKAIESAFLLPDAYEALALAPEYLKWLERVQTAGNYLMVRSTGSEDSRQMANAGGNVSKAYVAPDQPSLTQSIGEVVKSYFGYGSLQNRINAGQNPFEQDLKLAVTSQELIGETVGGDYSSCQIPISLVLFTDEPLYSGGENFRVMRISASYGHGEGVVGNLGIATDTVTVLISEAQPDQLYVLYDNHEKQERLAPVRNSEGVVGLQKTVNPPELQNTRALSSDMIARLYHWGIIAESFFDGEPTDMEIVIKNNTIYPVQARPVNRLPLLPTYLDRRKLAQAKGSVIKQSLQTEPLVPGRASTLTIDTANTILVSNTLQEAESVYKKDLHVLVIVHQEEPANSHPVVNFSNLGVPCLFAKDKTEVNALISQVSASLPLVVCMQTASLHLWKAEEAQIEDFISPGFAVHPAKIAISLPFQERTALPTEKKIIPEEIKAFLQAIRDSENEDVVVQNLEKIEQHPWIADLKLQNSASSFPSNEIGVRTGLVEAFSKQLNTAISESKATFGRLVPGARLKSLLQIKILESLLVGNPQTGGSINQYSLRNIWPTIEETRQLVAYQNKLEFPSKFIDVLLLGNQNFTEQAQQEWGQWLLGLENEAQLKNISAGEIQTFKRMLNSLDKASILPSWLVYYFPQKKQHWSYLSQFHFLCNSLSGEELAMIDFQLKKGDDLDFFALQIDLFAHPQSFRFALEELKNFAADESYFSLMRQNPFIQQSVLNYMGRLVEHFDSAIKTMKASPEWSAEAKVPLFKEMLLPYMSLLKNWHHHFSDHIQIPTHSKWGVEEYLNKLEELISKNENLGSEQLSPSANFSVAAAVLGSSALFNRHFPRTLEDQFTLIHQNLFVLVANLNKTLFSTREISDVPLPSIFKMAQDTIGHFKLPNSSSIIKIGQSISQNGVIFNYNIPLQNHSAKVNLHYEKDKKSLSIQFQFLGEARIRWTTIRTLLAAYESLNLIELDKNVFQNELELSISMKLRKPADIAQSLKILDYACDISFLFDPDSIYDLLINRQVDFLVIEKFLQHMIKGYIDDKNISERQIKDLCWKVYENFNRKQVKSTEDVNILKTLFSLKSEKFFSNTELIEKIIKSLPLEDSMNYVNSLMVSKSNDEISAGYELFNKILLKKCKHDFVMDLIKKGFQSDNVIVHNETFKIALNQYTQKIINEEINLQILAKGVKHSIDYIQSLSVYSMQQYLNEDKHVEFILKTLSESIIDINLSDNLFELLFTLISKNKSYDLVKNRIHAEVTADPGFKTNQNNIARAYQLLRVLVVKGEALELANSEIEKRFYDPQDVKIRESDSSLLDVFSELILQGQHQHLNLALQIIKTVLQNEYVSVRDKHAHFSITTITPLIISLIKNLTKIPHSLALFEKVAEKSLLNSFFGRDGNEIYERLFQAGVGFEAGIAVAKRGLENRNSEIRAASFELLVQIGAYQQEDIEALQNDPNPLVREKASEALATLNWSSWITKAFENSIIKLKDIFKGKRS